jgi:hypothetical protein
MALSPSVDLWRIAILEGAQGDLFFRFRVFNVSLSSLAQSLVRFCAESDAFFG